ncbi:MAG: histidinol-phosphate aminotransferase [Pseudonocardiales bacterium]|nr:histidinol-phosphate aminotransferase [Pseudonocardiales bacterium]
MSGAANVDLNDLPIRDDLRGQHPYGAPQLDVAVALNTNENSYPLPAGLINDIATAARTVAAGLNRYPDREAVALRADLADFLGHGLDGNEVWAANGSNEVLQQLFQAFAGPGRSVLGFTPSYSMHTLIARGVGSTFIDGRRAADFTLSAEHVCDQIHRHRPDIVILCSPNNPTGTALPLDVVRAAIDAAPGLVIVDEAYAEFARPGTVSALALLPQAPRLVVTRTMSKAFGMAGLRLGYLAAAAGVVDAVQLVRLPYHLSSLTQAAARAALARRRELLDTVDAVKHQRDRIVDTLTGLGFTVAPSDANFVFFGGLADSARAWQQLLDQGVLVRDLDLEGWLRVTAGTPTETDAFLAAITQVADDPTTWAPGNVTYPGGGNVTFPDPIGDTVGQNAVPEAEQPVQGGVRS